MTEPLPARLYLWERRTLYLGPLRSPVRLSLAASRLLVGLEGEIRFRHCSQQQEASARTLLLPVGWQGTLDSGRGRVADCHLDALGFDHALLRQLASRQEQQAGSALQNQAELLRTFEALSQGDAPAHRVYERLDQILNPPEWVVRTAFNVDARILATLQHLKSNTAENLSLVSLARQVGLSPSRLIGLFKQQVGIPIRRYRLWYRLFRCTQRMTTGTSLTQAALDAGFADSAHFSRTYRAILGFYPSALLSPRARLQVFVDTAGQPAVQAVSSFKPAPRSPR
ncbi:MAG: helix-turn-helix domain-containing protein [Pseudomonadota bacterium]